MPTRSAYNLIIAFSVTLLSQLGGNKYHSMKICESCLTCMFVAVRSECEFVRKFPLKYGRGHFGAKEPGNSIIEVDNSQFLYKALLSITLAPVQLRLEPTNSHQLQPPRHLADNMSLHRPPPEHEGYE